MTDAFDDAWHRFQRLDVLTLVSDTIEGQWARGRSAYLAFLVPIEHAAARDHISEVIERVARIPGVDPYPEPYWHMTIKGAGFEVVGPASLEEMASSDVDRIAEAAGPVFANEPAFEVQIGLAGGFPEVTFLEVWNAARIPALNSRLMEAIPTLPRYPIDGDNFLPHISFARFSSNEGLAPLRSVLAGLRATGPGPTFRVERIDLVRAHLSAGVPTFETIASYSLMES